MGGEALTRRSLLRTAGMAAAALPTAGLSPAFAQPRPAVRWSAAAATSGLPAPDPLVHLVNRVTFGVSPRDLARARQFGFEGFVEEQLHPETIEDSEVEAKVQAGFPTVGLDHRLAAGGSGRRGSPADEGQSRREAAEGEHGLPISGAQTIGGCAVGGHDQIERISLILG